MTKGVRGTEPDPRQVYGDIIDLPHHDPVKHPRMSAQERAAQFAPYAALVGYHDLVAEEARETDRQAELSEEEKEALNGKLVAMGRKLVSGENVTAVLTCFVPDEKKSGGAYMTVTAPVKKVDPVGGELVLDRKATRGGSDMRLAFDRLIRIEIVQEEQD